jgi:hypothetical protein
MRRSRGDQRIERGVESSRVPAGCAFVFLLKFFESCDSFVARGGKTIAG